MEQWYHKVWKAGTAVEIYDFDKQLIGIGTLLKDYIPTLEMEDCEEIGIDENMPEFMMEDGKIIQGCDCWWIPVEEAEKLKSLQEYEVSVTADGFEGFAMNVKVLAKDRDDAISLATKKPIRYHKEDPYVLLVHLNENDDEIEPFCSYATLADGLKHIKTIVSGRWTLVEHLGSGEGIVLKSWEDVE